MSLGTNTVHHRKPCSLPNSWPSEGFVPCLGCPRIIASYCSLL